MFTCANILEVLNIFEDVCQETISMSAFHSLTNLMLSASLQEALEKQYDQVTSTGNTN